MSKMMAQWLQKAKPGDKGLTRPPASARVSATRMRYGRLLVVISKTNSGCQRTNTSADQHKIHRNGTKLLTK